jgi:hypothetical protein
MTRPALPLDGITCITTTGSGAIQRSTTVAPQTSKPTTSLLPWQPKKTVHRSGCASSEVTSNQQGQDLHKEGPSHLDSWRPPPGETRPAKRRDNGRRGRRVRSPQRMRSESCRVVMWTPALLGQGGAEPRPVWAKAMEGVKSLDWQRRRTSRRRGSGMWTRLLVKLERPSRARPWSSHSRRLGSYKPRGEVGRCSEGVGGGRSTADGRARQRGRREGPLLRVCAREQVSVDECR